MTLEFLASNYQTTKNPLSGRDMFSATLTVRNSETKAIISQFGIGPSRSKSDLTDDLNLKIAEIRAADIGIARVVKIRYGTELIEVAPNGTRTNLTKQEEELRTLRPTISAAAAPTPGTVSSINNVTGGSQGGFTVSSFTTTSINFSVPTNGSFDMYINNDYVTSAGRPTGIYNLSLNSIKNFDTSSPATIRFVYPASGVVPSGGYTATFTASWSDTVGDPVTVSRITNITGGGGGFAVSSFNPTAIKLSVPFSGAFDVYVSNTYVATPSRPSGIYDITLNTIKIYDVSNPATVGFVFPATGADPGGVYTSTFTVSWLETVSDLNGAALTTEDTDQAVLDNLRTEEETINIVGNTLDAEFDGKVLNWWNNEVRPELEAINTTLQSILTQQTTLASKLTTIDANVNRIRILGDWGSYTDGEALGQGFKTTGLSSYNNIEKASLYKSLVLEGGILTYNKGIAEQNLSAGPIDPPQGIQQAAIDRIAALADEFDEVAVGTIPARNLPDDFEGNF